MAYQRTYGTTRFMQRSAAKLSLPSAWIDGELNDIYTILNSMTLSVNTSEWSLHNATVNYIDASSFTCAGDQTGTFHVKRRIRANLSGTYVYSKVSTAVYNSGTGLTTVTLADAVLTVSLSQIFYGILDTVNRSAGADSIMSDPVGDIAATNVQAAIAELETEKLKASDILSDFVIEGLLGTVPGSGLSMTTPAGKVWQSGVRIISTGFTQTYTASRDTYDSINNAGAITHTEVANGAAQPALPTNSQWLQKVVTGASAITSVTDMRLLNDVEYRLRTADFVQDSVVTGLLGTAPGSGYSMTIPGGIAYVIGRRVIKLSGTADLAHTYTAGKDTYVDIGIDGAITYSEVANNNYIISGLLGTDPGASLTMTTPAGTGYQSGTYITPAGGAYAYTASKDTYDSVDNAGAITHTAVNNGAGQPSLPANSQWFQKVVTNGTEITSVTEMRNTNSLLNAPALASNAMRLQRVFTNGTQITKVFDMRTVVVPGVGIVGGVANSLAMTGEVSGTASAASVDFDMGSVKAGDEIFVTMLASITLNSTGVAQMGIGKNSGTATISNGVTANGVLRSPYIYIPGGITDSTPGTITFSGIIHVTGDGTLHLYAAINQITATVTGNWVGYRAFFLKKQ